MRLLPEIVDSAQAIQEIRRNIHAHPELRFEENRTSDLVQISIRLHIKA